ncbi:hypothetical protein XAC3810_60019 [Xanthomonas citri pv. citri]|uniref:Uncharacterized protein n=1 Tax=Xanthomonas citri pv. citri TaxID=611301 RepID=A0A0U5FF55_XANCI|nr:hypothetical protein XAC902_60017 [Xanthomonas citri pv. citri]CEE44794.1 hypothetical protein XAC3810_60019 [Xanthomonas citri pv. citri]CEE44915.1 hypothetical protein XAC2911_60019 [Xanthomonas citri pv. citri]CEE67424.1 hypothetical protein XAC71A_80019 [Xanthomonas citri pv. citri]CEE67696.1 hypothetical protein XACW160_50020 [Xanthomonas citri pv. citri]
MRLHGAENGSRQLGLTQAQQFSYSL